MKKLIISLFLLMLLAGPASADRAQYVPDIVVTGLTAGRVVETDVSKKLISSGTTSAELENLTDGTNADALHLHTGSSISGIDISSDTNLAVTAPITLTGDTVGITVLKDLVVSGTGLSGGANDILPGSDGDVNITLAVSKDLVAGNGLTGGENDVFPGADADVTLTLGTPSTLTSATTNAVTVTSHTHAVTNYAVSGTANQVTVTGAGKVLGAATTLSLPNPINVSTSANAATVTVTADSAFATTNYLLFSNATSGSKSPLTNTGLLYNSSTNAITASSFIGTVAGNANTVYSLGAITLGTIAPGASGAVTIVIATDNAAIVSNAGNIVLSSSTVFHMDSGDTLTLVYDTSASKWREISRSFAM